MTFRFVPYLPFPEAAPFAGVTQGYFVQEIRQEVRKRMAALSRICFTLWRSAAMSI